MNHQRVHGVLMLLLAVYMKWSDVFNKNRNELVL